MTRPAVTQSAATRRLHVDRMRDRAADVRTVQLLRESAAEVQAAAIEAEHTRELHAQHSAILLGSVAALPREFERLASIASHEQAAAALRASADLLRNAMPGIPTTRSRDTGVMRTPDGWCRYYSITIYVPGGWRSDGTPWDTPLTLAEFWERAASSTSCAGDGWRRVIRDLERQDADR